MASNEATKQPHTDEGTRTPTPGTPPGESIRERATAPSPADDEAAREAARLSALEREKRLMQQQVRLARSPGAMGPLGRMVLLVAVFVLAALVGVALLLAL